MTIEEFSPRHNTNDKPARSIGEVAKEALRLGKSTQEVIDWVQLECHGSRICPSAVSNYRRDLRNNGEMQPSLRPVKRGAGFLAKQLLLKGLSTKDVIAVVKKQFPASNISCATVASYRHQLSKWGNESN